MRGHSDHSHLTTFCLKSPRMVPVHIFGDATSHNRVSWCVQCDIWLLNFFEHLEPRLATNFNMLSDVFSQFFSTRSRNETMLCLKEEAFVKLRKVVTSQHRKSVAPVANADVRQCVLIRTSQGTNCFCLKSCMRMLLRRGSCFCLLGLSLLHVLCGAPAMQAPFVVGALSGRAFGTRR